MLVFLLFLFVVGFCDCQIVGVLREWDRRPDIPSHLFQMVESKLIDVPRLVDSSSNYSELFSHLYRNNADNTPSQIEVSEFGGAYSLIPPNDGIFTLEVRSSFIPSRNVSISFKVKDILLVYIDEELVLSTNGTPSEVSYPIQVGYPNTTLRYLSIFFMNRTPYIPSYLEITSPIPLICAFTDDCGVCFGDGSSCCGKCCGECESNAECSVVCAWNVPWDWQFLWAVLGCIFGSFLILFIALTTVYIVTRNQIYDLAQFAVDSEEITKEEESTPFTSFRSPRDILIFQKYASQREAQLFGSAEKYAREASGMYGAVKKLFSWIDKRTKKLVLFREYLDQLQLRIQLLSEVQEYFSQQLEGDNLFELTTDELNKLQNEQQKKQGLSDEISRFIHTYKRPLQEMLRYEEELNSWHFLPFSDKNFASVENTIISQSLKLKDPQLINANPELLTLKKIHAEIAQSMRDTIDPKVLADQVEEAKRCEKKADMKFQLADRQITELKKQLEVKDFFLQSNMGNSDEIKTQRESIGKKVKKFEQVQENRKQKVAEWKEKMETIKRQATELIKENLGNQVNVESNEDWMKKYKALEISMGDKNKIIEKQKLEIASFELRVKELEMKVIAGDQLGIKSDTEELIERIRVHYEDIIGEREAVIGELKTENQLLLKKTQVFQQEGDNLKIALRNANLQSDGWKRESEKVKIGTQKQRKRIFEMEEEIETVRADAEKERDGKLQLEQEIRKSDEMVKSFQGIRIQLEEAQLKLKEYQSIGTSSPALQCVQLYNAVTSRCRDYSLLFEFTGNT
jgi:hypothetical protein